eukprot:COSAG03_NODE_109_length_12541_cov_147.127070_11_plen_123_part_00
MSSRGAPSQFSQFSVRIQYNSAIHELRTDAILKNAFCLADIFRSHSTPSHFHSITQGKECNVQMYLFPGAAVEPCLVDCMGYCMFAGFLDIIGMVSTDALQTRDELGYFSKQGMKIRDENQG